MTVFHGKKFWRQDAVTVSKSIIWKLQVSYLSQQDNNPICSKQAFERCVRENNLHKSFIVSNEQCKLPIH